MLKLSLLKNGLSFISNKRFPNVYRSAHVIADGRQSCYEHFDLSCKFNFENSESEIPLKKLNKSTLLKYKFPKICLKYTAEDCAEHAVAVGFENHSYVLPSFPLIISNEIILALGATTGNIFIHAEQYIHMFQPLKPNGNIVFAFKAKEIIDKANGSLYVFHFDCHDDDGNEICFLENIAYQFGVTGIGNKKSEKIIRPPERDADHVFEFQTVPLSSTFNASASKQMTESIFSPNLATQYYGITEKFGAEPHCHGQYYLGVIIHKLLSHFADGDVNLFRKVKTRFCAPVFPGNTLVTKAWQIKERIYFDCFEKTTGKNVLLGSYLDLYEKY